MVGLKFKGSMAQVKWKKLDRFIPDAPYWIERYVTLEDDGERMTVNYDAVGEVDLRMLQPRAMAAELTRLRPLGEGVAAVRELDAASHHRGDDDDQQHER